MKGFIKTWWHCLWILLTDIKHVDEHRMVKITPSTLSIATFFKSYWTCDCKNPYKNLKQTNEKYIRNFRRKL